MKRPFLGSLIKWAEALPVDRPADLTKVGQGTLSFKGNTKVEGQGTNFTHNDEGCLISVEGCQMKIKTVRSATQILLEAPHPSKLNDQYYPYKITPKLQFSKLYESVWDSLNRQECIGIFPEGGSHDQNHLLPLKAGICIMALGAAAKYKVPITLVPCGFNYYNQHNFRSKVIMEFGPPFVIPESLVQLYTQDRKAAISFLLDLCTKMLQNVTTTFQTYHQLSSLIACRSLYQILSSKAPSTRQKIQLNRRFAKGFQFLLANPQKSEQIAELQKMADFVKQKGLPITYEPYFGSIILDTIKLLIYSVKLLTRLFLMIPGFVLMAPASKLISYLAEKQRVRCLKASKVKKLGRDVVGSYKILLGMTIFPISFSIYSLIVFVCLYQIAGLSLLRSILTSFGLLLLLLIYSALLIRSYDSIGNSFRKFNMYWARVFQSQLYREFNVTKMNYARRIAQIIDKYDSNTLKTLEEHRIQVTDQDLEDYSLLLE